MFSKDNKGNEGEETGGERDTNRETDKEQGRGDKCSGAVNFTNAFLLVNHGF